MYQEGESKREREMYILAQRPLPSCYAHILVVCICSPVLIPEAAFSCLNTLRLWWPAQVCVSNVGEQMCIQYGSISKGK